MSWTGYNDSSDSVRVLLQQSSGWSESSTPVTSSDVERINEQVYSEINIALEGEGIDITGLTDTDLKSLSLINDMGTAGIIEKIKFGGVPQFTDKQIVSPESWIKKYERALESFINSKKRKRQNSSYSGFGCHSTIKATTPLFERDQQW